MRQWLLSHLTYANVMVTLLAFVVLGGGTALGAYVITSNSQVGPNTIAGHHPPEKGEYPNIIGGSINSQDVTYQGLTGVDHSRCRRGDLHRLNGPASSALGRGAPGRPPP
jgi:hypothetical protein